MGLEDRELVEAKNAPPTIDAPEGGMSSRAPGNPQPPTGFGGPMPGEDTSVALDTGLSSPNTLAPRSSPYSRSSDLFDRQFSPETQGALRGMNASEPSAWTPEDRLGLEIAMLYLDDSLVNNPKRLTDQLSLLMENSGPGELFRMTPEKFQRQLGMNTQEMFEERTVMQLLRMVDDDVALASSVGDYWLDTWGNATSAGQVFLDANSLGKGYSDAWLSGSNGEERRREIAEKVGAAEYAAGVEAINEHEMFDMGAWTIATEGSTADSSRRELEGLSDKGAMWVLQDNNLAIKFYNADGVWESLVRLRPGTEIKTNTDAVAAYMLATHGVEHTLDPTSTPVPGGQTPLGWVYEKADDAIAAFERWGSNGTLPSLKQQMAQIERTMMPGRPSLPVDGEDIDDAAIREQYEAAHPEKATRNALIVNAARRATLASDAPMGAIVHAGIAGVEQLGDDGVASIYEAKIDDLVKQAEARAAEQSWVGKNLQEHVFDPVLTGLYMWENSLQFVGAALVDMTMWDERADLARLVSRDGIGAIFDPANAELLLPVDVGQFVEDFRDIREVGLPAFSEAYVEERYGQTVADEFGIEPDSALGQWVNTGASIAFDPITYLTLGGNASWATLRKSLTTAAGAAAYVRKPVFQSFARQIVGKTNTDMMAILAGQGLSSSAQSKIRRILGTTFDSGSDDFARAMDDVTRIFEKELPANGGHWLPSSPGQVMTRKTAMGLGRFFARLGQKGWKGEKYWKLAQDILVRAPRTRTATINPRDFVSQNAYMLSIRYGDDLVRWGDKYDDMLNVFDTFAAGGDAGAMIEGQIVAARKELDTLAAGLTNTADGPGVNYANTLQTSIAGMDDSVRALDEQIASRTAAAAAAQGTIKEAPAKIAALQQQIDSLTNKAGRALRGKAEEVKTLRDELGYLERTVASGGKKDADSLAVLEATRERAIAARAESQRLLDEVMPYYNDIHSAMKDKKNALNRYIQAMSYLDSGIENRAILERWVVQFYDEWAEDINAAYIKKGWAKTDDAGKKVVPIPTTGKMHPVFGDIPVRDWSNVTGKTSQVNFQNRLERAGSLEAFGVEGASEARDIGMTALAGNTPLPASPYELLAFTHTTPETWRVLHETRRGLAFRKTMDTIQTVWSASVLLNPRTALRSNLDEVIRFYEEAGAGTDLARTMWGSVPGTGRLSPAPSSGGRAFARSQSNSFVPQGGIQWQMVDPSKRGMWQSAERWINGTLMQDVQFKAFARAVANSGGDDAVARQLWEEWWNQSGSKLAKRTTYSSTSKARGGTQITADNAFDVMTKSFDTFLDGIGDDIFRGNVREEMIAVAANGKQLSKKPGWWRKMPSVPGEQTSATIPGVGGAVDAGFNFFYGAPQARRGGAFFDHYQDFALQTYRQANKGKILDAEWLLNKKYVKTLEEGQALVAAGSRNPRVREIVAKTGYVLDEDLRIAAMNWAAQNADNMMYTFGAGSILGKKMARVYPFGRAQVDYLQWWMRKLKQPTRFVGDVTPSIAGRAVPGNLRLIDRMAHLSALGTPSTDGGFERPGATTPAGMVNNLTFLPYTLDEQILMETTPSLGPMAGWALNLPVIPDVVREGVQQLHPAHAVFTEPYESPGDAWDGLVDTIIPKSGLSLWNLGETAYNLGLVTAAALTVGLNPLDDWTLDEQRRVNHVTSRMIDAAEGPYERDQQSFLLSEYLDESGFDDMPTMDNDAYAVINDQAVINALKENVSDTFEKIGGAAVQSGSDFRYVESLMPAADYAVEWLEDGHISQAKYDSIAIGAGVLADGGGTPTDRKMYADDVLDTLFKMLPSEERTRYLAENPGAAINFVSWYWVVPSLVPEDAQAGVDGNRIIYDGDDRYDYIQRGKAEGWIIQKDPIVHAYEAHVAVQRAARDRISDIYEETIGVGIGVRTKEVLESTMVIDSAFWDNYGEWLTESGGVDLPAQMRSALVAGLDYTMTVGDYRTIMKAAKDRFMYKYVDDSLHEATLNRMGTDDTPRNQLTEGLKNLEGFEDVNFDAMQPLSYYGAGLVEALNASVDAIEREHGWANPSEWEGDKDVGIETVADDGTITIWPSYNELAGRLKTAVALSLLGPDDDLKYTPEIHQSSQWYRWFGSPDYEPPQPPPLSEVKAYHTVAAADMNNVTVIDGDTVEIAGDGGPVPIRLIGLAAPEEGELGYESATLGFQKLLDEAEEVSFVIWQPERFGRQQTFFTEGPEGVSYRERTFMWLYVDGVPIYDERLFSATNVRGVQTGGGIPQYQAYKRREEAKGGD